ncbi:MAG: matrixin family metalloprotease, partial [Bacteroidota bacterium]
MKKTTFNAISMAFLCLIMTQFAAKAQDLTYEIPLNVQVYASPQIVEGKVISKKSYWDADYQNIYSVNTIEVYKVFKGQALSTIEVITPGGSVGLEYQIVDPSLKLRPNDIGIFTLVDNTVNVPTNQRAFESYSDVQGFYKYNVFNNTVVNPYRIKQGISDFYDDVVGLTGSNYTVMNNYNVDEVVADIEANRGGLAITSLSPGVVTAGTQTTITIGGSGFGSTVGFVRFSDANSGGASLYTALESQIVSWSDTQIVVEVPDRAGTGGIQVQNSTSDIGNSPFTLTVTYAHINVESDALSAGTFVAYETQHVDDNAAGGYTWQMFTDFDANTAANASFLRALDTWRCETGINWTVGAVTATDVAASDGINIVRFDNTTELPSGVLGRCTSRFSGCFINGATDLQWYVNELDIVFNDTTNWEFGPSAPSFSEVDFESVAVHELGHGHQLAHVIDNSVVMHFAIGGGTSLRNLSAGDIAGAGAVQTRSTTTAACSTTSMIHFDCAVLSVSEEELSAAIDIYPNPSNGRVFINNDGLVDVDNAVVYDVNGR